jgi:hypothetical protein
MTKNQIIISISVISVIVLGIIFYFLSLYYINLVYILNASSISIAIISLILTIWVFINSENIKEHIDKKNTKLIYKRFNVQLTKMKLESIIKLLEEEESNDILIRTKISSLLGELQYFEKIFDRNTKNAIKKLNDAAIYEDGNNEVCRNLSIINTQLEVLKIQEKDSSYIKGEDTYE